MSQVKPCPSARKGDANQSDGFCIIPPVSTAVCSPIYDCCCCESCYGNDCTAKKDVCCHICHLVEVPHGSISLIKRLKWYSDVFLFDPMFQFLTGFIVGSWIALALVSSFS